MSGAAITSVPSYRYLGAGWQVANTIACGGTGAAEDRSTKGRAGNGIRASGCTLARTCTRGVATVTTVVPGGGRLRVNTIACGAIGVAPDSGGGSRGGAMRIASAWTMASTVLGVMAVAVGRGPRR
jgi:hypothetical protein